MSNTSNDEELRDKLYDLAVKTGQDEDGTRYYTLSESDYLQLLQAQTLEADRLARIDELEHVAISEDGDEIILCYFNGIDGCDKDVPINDRLAKLTNQKEGKE